MLPQKRENGKSWIAGKRESGQGKQELKEQKHPNWDCPTAWLSLCPAVPKSKMFLHLKTKPEIRPRTNTHSFQLLLMVWTRKTPRPALQLSRLFGLRSGLPTLKRLRLRFVLFGLCSYAAQWVVVGGAAVGWWGGGCGCLCSGLANGKVGAGWRSGSPSSPRQAVVAFILILALHWQKISVKQQCENSAPRVQHILTHWTKASDMHTTSFTFWLV